MKQKHIKEVIECLMLKNVITERECIRIWKEVLKLGERGN